MSKKRITYIHIFIWLFAIFANLPYSNFHQGMEATGSKSRVVLTTAYDQYALKGYELNVTDYLLKPFSFQRFLQVMNKVMEYYSQITDANKTISGSESFIFVKTEYRLERIDIDSILYIKGMKDYLRIICSDKKIMTLQSFAKIVFLRVLDPNTNLSY
jgi:Response regulator of the LytR/AlgR family